MGLRDDQACSSAKVVYGSFLVLPGMFLDAPEFPLEIFKSRIHSVLQSFSAPPNHNVRATAPAVFASLKTATHVFVCEDSTTSPLRLLYRGLYLALQKDVKYFTLQLGARADKFSRDKAQTSILYRSYSSSSSFNQRTSSASSSGLFVAPCSSSLGLIKFSAFSASPSGYSLTSLSSSPVLRRNPPRAASQPTTASSSKL